MADTLSTARGQLRQSAAVRGRGWQQLVKPANPATGGGFTRTVPGDYWERLLSLAFTVTLTAGAGTRSLALAYQDGDGYTFNLVPISNELGPSQSLTGYADLASVTPVAVPESHEIEGSQTSPAAGTTIVSLTLPSGGWTLQWVVMLTGTLAAADTNNFQLNQGATQLLVSENGITAGVQYGQEPVEIQVPIGGQTITVKNIALATTGAVYTAQLVAVPSNVMQLQVQIPDFVMKPGWQVALQLGSAQAGDAITGIGMLLERYPSTTADLPHHADLADILTALGVHIPGG